MIQEAYVKGISTRSVDDLVKAMGMSGISKSQVSRPCEDRSHRGATGPSPMAEGRQGEGLPQPAAGRGLDLTVDRRDLPRGPARRAGRHCRSDQWRNNGQLSVAVIPAIGRNTDGRREVPGLETGTSEAEPIWTEFLRKLTRRGLRGVKPVISDAHEGIKPAVSKGLSATWQRCRRRRENSPPECFPILLGFQRNALAHAGKGGRRPGQKTTPRIAFWPGSISAFIATACAQGEADQRLIGGINRPPNAEAASTQWRAVADQIRRKVPKLAALMERAMVAPRVRETMARAEHDVLAYMSFPRSTGPSCTRRTPSSG